MSDFEGFEEQMIETGEVVSLHDNRSEEQMRKIENESEMNEDTSERQMSDNWQISDNLSEEIEKITDKIKNHAQNNDGNVQTNELGQVSVPEQVNSYNPRELKLILRDMAILRREKEVLEKGSYFYKQKEEYQKLIEAVYIRSANNNNEVPQSSTNSNNNDEKQGNGHIDNSTANSSGKHSEGSKSFNCVSSKQGSQNYSISQCNNNGGIQNDGKLSFVLLKELVPEYDGSASPEIFVAQLKNLAILYSVLMTKLKGEVQTWLHSEKKFVH